MADHLKILKTMILEDAAFYDAPMNEIKLRLFTEELSQLPVTEVHRALKHFRQEPGRSKMPLPADVKSFLKPKIEDKDQARDCAVLILKAISKRGIYWSMGSMINGERRWEGQSGQFHDSFESAFKSFCGDLAWEVTNRFGSWTALCELSFNSQETTLLAQLRDLADSLQKKARAGSLDQAPGLPAAQSSSAAQLGEGQNKMQALVHSTLKGMP